LSALDLAARAILREVRQTDSRVALDEFLEVLQYGDELLLVLVSLINLVAQPRLLNAVIRWEPSSCPAKQCISFAPLFRRVLSSLHPAVLVRNIMVISVLMNHCEYRLADASNNVQ
jgi:hypothetical protein